MTAPLPKAFISYRRSDSLAATGRLYDRLNVAYPGMFFRDVSGIGVGVDFTKEIERAVSSSIVLIAVIGPTWATESGDGTRRLDDPDDFVRLELSGALTRNIRIIPVLVAGASMPEEEQLPAVLHPLRKWNAIQLVEEYYEEGLQRLIDALSSQLGEPRTREGVDQDRNEAERKLKELRGEAESALAVEDWFAGIQALQAAVSLDHSNAELSTRLRWAHDQRKVSTLFAEGQELYEQGKKSLALARFRQVRVTGGSYRNVTELIGQLERELASDNRRSTVRRWTTSAVAAVCLAIVAAGGLIVWVVRSEFAAATTEGDIESNLLDILRTEADSNQLASPTASARSAVDAVRTPSPRRTPDAAPAEQGTSGPGFPGVGDWRMTARENQDMSIVLSLEDDGSFQVSMPAGVLNLPLSGGRYAYDDSTGMLQITGMNNVNAFFSEVIHVVEREDDHFHATYLGTIWELESEE
jgi:hypothetical protein